MTQEYTATDSHPVTLDAINRGCLVRFASRMRAAEFSAWAERLKIGNLQLRIKTYDDGSMTLQLRHLDPEPLGHDVRRPLDFPNLRRR